MKTIVLFLFLLPFMGQCLSQIPNQSTGKPSSDILKADTLHHQPGKALYFELLGKGIFSLNFDFPIKQNHRLSIGFTQLDYDLMDEENFHIGRLGTPTPGIMYYYLFGKSKSFLEIGVGLSIFYRFDLKYNEDSPFSIHGVIGYRYQKENGMIFRAGFTPFKRINNWFLPLIGLSIGYSW